MQKTAETPYPILGLDLATKTGIAILDGLEKTIILSETFILPGKEPGKKLLAWAEHLNSILSRFQISSVAIEDIFLPKQTSPKTAVWLGELRGLTRFLCAQRGLTPTFYAPTSIKQGITGSGRAGKEDLRWILEQEFAVHFVDDNASDALAVAYIHYLHGSQADEDREFEEARP